MKKQILLFVTFLTYTLSFSQANTFPATGNVGIGTGATAPAAKLQLTSATAGTSGLRLTNLLSTTAVTTGLLGKALSVNATGDVVLVPVSNTDTSLFIADGALASIRTVNMAGFNLIFNPSTASSQFFINGVNGNTGIGTITPASKLDVKGGVAVGATYAGTTAAPANGAIIEGNVGIGTNAPATKLQITSATAGTSGLRLTNLLSTTAVTTGLTGKALSVNTTGDVVLVPVANSDTDTSLFIADGALASARTVTMGSNNLTFNPSTASSQFFINGTNGNIGIGNAAPTTRLELTSGTAGNSGLKFTNLLSTSTAGTGNGKALTVDTAGNVILVPMTGAGGTDIYTTNGTLSSARTMTMSGNSFTFNPSTASSQFFINGTNGNTGIGNITPTTRLEVSSGTAGDSGLKLTNLLSTSATVAANGKALSVDTTGKVVLVPATTASYDTDASLTASRTVTMGGNNLTFNPSTASSQFFINGTSGNVGIGNTAPVQKLDVVGNIIAGGLSSVEGVNGFSLRYGNDALSNWGALRSSGATYMSFGVKSSSTVAEGWLSSTGAIPTAKYAFTMSGINGFQFLTSPSATHATNAVVTMNEVVRIDNTGKVGIGTNAPTTKLEVKTGVADTSGLKFTNLTNASATVAGNNKALSVDASGNVVLVPVLSAAAVTPTLYTNDGSLAGPRTVSLVGNNLAFNSTAGNAFTVNGANGNVGIGTSSPTANLEVGGITKSNQLIVTNNQANGQTYSTTLDRNDKCVVFSAGSIVGTGPGYVNTRMLNFFDFPGPNAGSNLNSSVFFGIEDRNDQGRFRMTATTGGDTNFQVLNKSQQDLFKVYEDGNDKVTITLPKPDSYIGIGTSSFLDSADNKTYRLSVKGRVRAEEIKVYNTWADYVFNKEYNLRSLNDLEAYIKANGHLPNVPSAQEVTEKGLELGEMTKIQQEKIEELTLYLIQQNKEIQELKAQMKALMEKK